MAPQSRVRVAGQRGDLDIIDRLQPDQQTLCVRLETEYPQYPRVALTSNQLQRMQTLIDDKQAPNEKRLLILCGEEERRNLPLSLKLEEERSPGTIRTIRSLTRRLQLVGVTVSGEILCEGNQQCDDLGLFWCHSGFGLIAEGGGTDTSNNRPEPDTIRLITISIIILSVDCFDV